MLIENIRGLIIQYVYNSIATSLKNILLLMVECMWIVEILLVETKNVTLYLKQ